MRSRWLGTVLWLLCVLGAADASGQGEGPADAGRHFRHGVELYGEANYSGALVEFKRAFALAPTSAALYDIGEAEFQLQYYAEALKTFRQFLAKYGQNEGHRAEVETNIQVLASRVGTIRVSTTPAGADVALDDEAVGKTPFDEPLLVSVGRRKVVASMPGRPPTTQVVEVAAGDDVAVSLSLPGPIEEVVERPSPEGPSPPIGPAVVHKPIPPMLRTAGWIAASTLAAGSITFGALAIGQANALAQARSGLTTSATLDHHANLTSTFAVLADSMGAAALITGAISLYWTVSSAEDHRRVTAQTSHVTIGPASAFFETMF